MIIVDTALKKRAAENNPVNVGLVGAGYIGCGITLQIEKYLPGMRVAAIANRTLRHAEKAYHEAGIDSITRARNVSELETAIARKKYAVTEDASQLCAADGIDVIIEATGHVEFSAHVAFQAIRNGKHIVLMNAELDATVGPILKVYADKAGVVFTTGDGDQPGVMMNLYRFVSSIGYQPVLLGNIKGLQDRYRTPETQKGFAAKAGISPQMATSFADGTKISMENAVVANATGFTVGRRGMHGPECKHVSEAVNLFPLEQMMSGGIVDYILGAEPGPGVFVLGYNDHPARKPYMQYFKMGDGPLYPFYIPYHLPHLEVPLTAARAVLFNDAAGAPLAGLVCDVITTAKTDLKKDSTLDGIGGFSYYGVIDNSDICRAENLLPVGLAEGCRLKRDIAKDQAISYDDVVLPGGRLCDQLRAEQDDFFKS
ncbi:MAG: NAD(P)-dependent oxidoreductase [Desulfobacteraceae bacterium]|nr:NAD(P)-dependent oxidoreductase [Desulfobacteraceae bacterium]